MLGNNRRGNHSAIILFILVLVFINIRALAVAAWTELDNGLLVGRFEVSLGSPNEKAQIVVIKIDPIRYQLRLLCASQLDHESLTIEEWCKRYNLIGAINAGMFQEDRVTNVGYMKNFYHINNNHISSLYRSVVAFNPKIAVRPPFRIYDMDEVSIREIIKDYNTVIQNLRLIKRPGENRWSKQKKKWSEAALGEDNRGNALFIFCRFPVSMYDLNQVLLRLPIRIVCAQHLEGGPQAALYFSFKGEKIRLVGSYNADFSEGAGNDPLWAVPNVIGIVKGTEGCVGPGRIGK